jgi:hypothetical protein
MSSVLGSAISIDAERLAPELDLDLDLVRIAS